MINKTGKIKKEVLDTSGILQVIEEKDTRGISVFDLGLVPYDE